MKKDFIMPILVLSFICLIISGALAFVNSITRPVIDQAAAERAYEARKEILPQADEFVLVEVEDLPRSVTEVYATTNNVGFIITVTAHGYGGDFKLICGISPEGTIIMSRVLSHNETQGLGTIVFDRAHAYVGKDKNLDGIDAISGSTITFNAYKDGIRDAFEAFEIVKGAQP
jgi:electron transport complex protein RnfG